MCAIFCGSYLLLGGWACCCIRFKWIHHLEGMDLSLFNFQIHTILLITSFGRVMLYVFASSMVTLCNFIILFQGRTGGPIFAGPCTSFALPSQVKHHLQVRCYKIVSYIFFIKLKISSVTSTFVNKAVTLEWKILSYRKAIISHVNIWNGIMT